MKKQYQALSCHFELDVRIKIKITVILTIKVSLVEARLARGASVWEWDSVGHNHPSHMNQTNVDEGGQDIGSLPADYLRDRQSAVLVNISRSRTSAWDPTSRALRLNLMH